MGKCACTTCARVPVCQGLRDRACQIPGLPAHLGRR
jgi:hypothetical protein